MTGNVLFLGFALVGAPHVPLLGTVVAGRAVPRPTASVVPRATLGALAAVTAALVVLRAAAVASSLAARRLQQRQGAAEGRASTT